MKDLHFKLLRINDNNDSTIGYLSGEGFFSFTLEDQPQKVKVKGETRIPAGVYEITIRAVDSPLTLKHRKSYGDWFEYHLEISGIPKFQFVYFHAGNDDDHTEGCVLLSDEIRNNDLWMSKQSSHSIQAVKRFYELVYPHVKAGGKAFITVVD